jgi:hypothetical protein
MGWYGLDSSGSKSGLVEDSCEHSNEPSKKKKSKAISATHHGSP